MPFTPFHMGPGMAVKAAMPRHFSIVVFGFTQIVLDLEVLWRLARRGWINPLGYPANATSFRQCLVIIGEK